MAAALQGILGIRSRPGTTRRRRSARLNELLRLWRLRAVAYASPGCDARVARARGGNAEDFAPAEQGVPGWPGGRLSGLSYRVEFGGGAQVQFHALPTRRADRLCRGPGRSALGQRGRARTPDAELKAAGARRVGQQPSCAERAGGLPSSVSGTAADLADVLAVRTGPAAGRLARFQYSAGTCLRRRSPPTGPAPQIASTAPFAPPFPAVHRCIPPETMARVLMPDVSRCHSQLRRASDVADCEPVTLPGGQVMAVRFRERPDLTGQINLRSQ
jgi:hypothetical protein